MSDVERLTFTNHQRMRYAEEISREREEKERALRKVREAEEILQRRRRWKKAGAALCNMAAGFFLGVMAFCFVAAVTGTGAPLSFILAILFFLGGIALDEEEW